jgi:hypothetical protein
MDFIENDAQLAAENVIALKEKHLYDINFVKINNIIIILFLKGQ